MQINVETMTKDSVQPMFVGGGDPERSVFRKLDRVINEMRDLDPEMQAQTISILLQVAAQPGIPMRELERKTGIRSSSVSRNVAALSKTHRNGAAGLNLVIAKEDPNDRRTKQVFLTHRGERLMAKLIEIIGG